MRMVNAIIKGILTSVLLIAVLSGVVYTLHSLVQMLQRMDPTLRSDDVIGATFGMIMMTVIFTAAWYHHSKKTKPCPTPSEE